MNLNQECYKILKGLESVADVTEYGDSKILDLGINRDPGMDVGIKIAEVTMGSLGEVRIEDNRIHVSIPEKPSIACLGCQLADWAILIGDKNRMGSGPARILARKPPGIIDKIGYREKSDKAAIVIETPVLPDEKTCNYILKSTGAKKLIIAAFRENSKVGFINIMARVVEMALFRLDNLGYNTDQIISAEGTAPLPKLDDRVMFTSNDAIIYGSSVRIEVKDWDPELTEKMVSRASKFYGRSFEEIFNEAGGDFYRIDPSIFAPAELRISFEGNHYHIGRIDQKIIERIGYPETENSE